MFGISLAYLKNGTIEENVRLFLSLQEEFTLNACEIHMEAAQFSAALLWAATPVTESIAVIRGKVEILGVHLPYLDLNPISAVPHIAEFAIKTLETAISKASDIGADYVVFHARGVRRPEHPYETDIDCWAEVVTRLTQCAQDKNMVFCLENADDLRSIEDIAKILEKSPLTKVCLDIGHLFERLYIASIFGKLVAKAWDRWLPWSSLAGRGLPFYEMGSFGNIVYALKNKMFCIHVHNHNGRLAHQPLMLGKADLKALLGTLAAEIKGPIILEADYRNKSYETIIKDIILIKKVLP